MATVTKRANQYEAKHDFDFGECDVKKGDTIYAVHQHFGSSDRGTGHTVHAIVDKDHNWIGDCHPHNYDEVFGSHVVIIKEDLDVLKIN